MSSKVYRLYVGGLPATISVEELRCRFERFGEVQEIGMPNEKFPVNPERPGNRGFAFVSLLTTKSFVTSCITTYSGCVWRGSKLYIAVALPNFKDRLDLGLSTP